MKFEIKPKIGVDVVHFGMDTNSVRQALGGQFESFLRTPASTIPCDYFAHIGVFAYYKLPGVLEALEFAAPAELSFKGANLLGALAFDVKRLLEQFDETLELDSSGIISHQLGIGVYAPGWDEEEAQVVESAILFEEGYYS